MRNGGPRPNGLDAINKRIAALSVPAERFNKSLGEVTGINRAAEGMQTPGDRALGAARAVERLAGPMVGIPLFLVFPCMLVTEERLPGVVGRAVWAVQAEAA